MTSKSSSPSGAPQWLQIRQARGDLSDYLIHWTRGAVVDSRWVSPFDILKRIVSSGFLMPTFAPRDRVTVGGTSRTIHGNTPAVCFTDQPLGDFVDSCRVLPGRYVRYGVVLHKWHLYMYGGRPAIYGDESLLAALPEEFKHLWVRYNPIPTKSLGNFPVDWTHEREWRCRVHRVAYGSFGSAPPEGVPLLLPPVQYPSSSSEVLAFPRFLVRTQDEQHELRTWITELPGYAGQSGALREYFKHLPSMRIVPLDEVEARIRDGRREFARFETLPYAEIDPVVNMPTPESYF